LRAADERAKPNGERIPTFRDSARESLELELFSNEPIHDDYEILRLTDSLSDFASAFGADSPLGFDFDEKIQYIKKHPLEHNFIVQNNSNPDKSKIYYFKLELIDEYIYSDQYSFVISKTFDNVTGEEVILFFVCDWSNGERNFLISYLEYIEPAIDRYLEEKNLRFKNDNSNILYYKEQVEETKNQLEDDEKKSEDSNIDKQMFVFLIIIIILGFVMLFCVI
jgi:hypothetical protein